MVTAMVSEWVYNNCLSSPKIQFKRLAEYLAIAVTLIAITLALCSPAMAQCPGGNCNQSFGGYSGYSGYSSGYSSPAYSTYSAPAQSYSSSGWYMGFGSPSAVAQMSQAMAPQPAYQAAPVYESTAVYYETAPPRQSKQWMYSTLADGTKQSVDTTNGNIFRWDRDEQTWLLVGNSLRPESLDSFRGSQRRQTTITERTTTRTRSRGQSDNSCGCGCVNCQCGPGCRCGR